MQQAQIEAHLKGIRSALECEGGIRGAGKGGTNAVASVSAEWVYALLLRCTPKSAKHLMAKKKSVMRMRKAPGDMEEKIKNTSPLRKR